MLSIFDKEIARINNEASKVKNRWDLISNALKHIKQNGDIFEFGVFKGRSLRYILENTELSKIYAFDSFIGLPEAWPGYRSSSHPAGHFNLRGNIPSINNDRIIFIDGFFEQTLPEFCSNYNDSISFIHIDCDIYSSTKTIFKYLGQKLISNTIIVFDELIGYRDFELNEIKAWLEFVQSAEISYSYLYYAKEQVCVKIL